MTQKIEILFRSITESKSKMAYSLQDRSTILYNIKTANTIPMVWLVNDFNSLRGPNHCETCRMSGMFCGVYYGLCVKCIQSDDNLEQRITIINLIKSLQDVVTELTAEYPTDEYGIVKEAVDSGFYILNVHTKHQYEKMMVEGCKTVQSDRKTVQSDRKTVQSDRKTVQSDRKTVQADYKEQTTEDFEYCAECDELVYIGEINDRGYCLECQNPDYDPVWPKGD
jgi:hypothetical protein